MKPIDKEQLEEVLKEGWLPIHEMAARLNASYYRIKKSLHHHGLLQGRKPHIRRRMNDGSRVIKILAYIMANPEMSFTTIASQFNCSREYVSQIDGAARKEGIIK